MDEDNKDGPGKTPLNDDDVTTLTPANTKDEAPTNSNDLAFSNETVENFYSDPLEIFKYCFLQPTDRLEQTSAPNDENDEKPQTSKSNFHSTNLLTAPRTTDQSHSTNLLTAPRVTDPSQLSNENKTNSATDLAAKEFPSDQTLNQILKAHSEQSTAITARLEVSQRAPNNYDEEAQLKKIPLDKDKDGETLNSKKEENSVPNIQVKSTETSEMSPNNLDNGNSDANDAAEIEMMPSSSIRSIGSLVCRICHNSENPEKLVSPCLCKGSLTYVHIHCLERWISTSRSTSCELCQFQYNTEQTLRYTCFQSLRMWYSRSMSRRALQEDCQMFSLLTLVAFGIIGTLIVGIQYYYIHGYNWSGLGKLWTKGWLLFFLFTTVTVYFLNVYMIVRSQLTPWYRWWQSARDIKLILENRRPFKFRPNRLFGNRQIPETTASTQASSESSSSIDELNSSLSAAPQAAASETNPTPPLSGQYPVATHTTAALTASGVVSTASAVNAIRACIRLQNGNLEDELLLLPEERSKVGELNNDNNQKIEPLRETRSRQLQQQHRRHQHHHRNCTHGNAAAVFEMFKCATVVATAVEIPLEGFVFECESAV